MIDWSLYLMLGMFVVYAYLAEKLYRTTICIECYPTVDGKLYDKYHLVWLFTLGAITIYGVVHLDGTNLMNAPDVETAVRLAQYGMNAIVAWFMWIIIDLVTRLRIAQKAVDCTREKYIESIRDECNIDNTNPQTQ